MTPAITPPGTIFPLENSYPNSSPASSTAPLTPVMFSPDLTNSPSLTTRRYFWSNSFYYVDEPDSSTENKITVDESLALFYQIINKEQFPFSEHFLANLELADWLSRIPYIADFNADQGEKRAIVAKKIIDFLELAANPDHQEFHNLFFRMVENATRSCGDSMSLSILHLEIAKQLALLEKRNSKGLATLLVKGTWVLSQLEDLARGKIKTLLTEHTETSEKIDEIEVYLGYPVKLKETLDIPINIHEMLYFYDSKLTEEDLQLATDYILDSRKNKEKTCNFLVSQEIWINMLDDLGLLEEIKAERNRQAEEAITDTDYIRIDRAYQQNLKELTARQLSIDGFIFTQS